MATYAKLAFSASTDGRGIKVTQTASAGDTIHTAINNTDDYDEIWLYAVNSDTTARKLTIEFGGTSAPDDTIEMTIPAESGLFQVIPGLVLQNSLVVKAFAASANVVCIHGFVNRITT